MSTKLLYLLGASASLLLAHINSGAIQAIGFEEENRKREEQEKYKIKVPEFKEPLDMNIIGLHSHVSFKARHNQKSNQFRHENGSRFIPNHNKHRG